MMRHLLNLTVMLAMAGALVHGDDYRLRDETTTRHTLRFSGTGERSLTLRNINGSIRVNGTSDADVQLDVRRVVRADSQADLRRGADEWRLATADQRSNVEAVVRDADGIACGEPSRRRDNNRRREPDYSVAYDFTVGLPAGTRLVLCTINGSAEVTRTSGDFDVESVNGRVRMVEVRGSGSAATVNGSLDATFVNAPSRDAVFKTVNGSVTVTWPAGLSADLQLKTLNGGLFTDFDVQSLPTTVASRSRRNGRFVYRSDNSASVRVGQGGPKVTLESVNGDIRILRSSR